MTVLEEEVVERTVSSTRRYVIRQPPVGATGGGAPAAQDWDVDGDDPVEEPADEVADWSIDDDPEPAIVDETSRPATAG